MRHTIWKKISCISVSIMLSFSLLSCGTVQTNTADETDTAEAVESETTEEYNFDHSGITPVDDNYRNYYEIFVHSYYDSDGDGIGDLNGVTEKLDYIQDMGFTGIWLMPIMPSTTYHKYDVTDYLDVDAEYGTLDDFDTMITAAHEKGIRVILDLVMNHTSSKHPWFIAAEEYLQGLQDEEPSEEDCKYFGYYHFSKEEQDNYYRVPGTDWFYEGSFWSEMPDLNLTNENVIAEFDAIADFWIERGVDGFRMDAAMHYDDSNMNVNLEALNHLYTHCTEENPDFYMVSEVWADEGTIADYYESETPSMFNFPVSGAEGLLAKAAKGKYKASKYVQQLLEYETTYSIENTDYIDAPFLTNHDQVRIANNLMSNEDNLKMAAGLLLTMSGNPFVYYGEEVGMKSSGTEDPNKRLPMHWSDTDETGITNVPEGADSDVEQNFDAVDVEETEETSLLNYYKRALWIRNEYPEIARGSITIVQSENVTNDNTAAILKTWNESKIGILYNLSEDEQSVDLAGTELEGMQIVSSLTLDNSEVKMDQNTIKMPGKSILILK